jgi:hypothetical protein
MIRFEAASGGVSNRGSETAHDKTCELRSWTITSKQTLQHKKKDHCGECHVASLLSCVMLSYVVFMLPGSLWVCLRPSPSLFMSCHVMLCFVTLRYVMLCHVMSCHVILCHVMLSHVVLCYQGVCRRVFVQVLLSELKPLLHNKIQG